MQFKLWLENVEKSIRRKLQRAVWKYLGVPSNITSFQVGQEADLEDPQAANLFGQPTGTTTRTGQINLLQGQEASGIHEILHATGFMEDGICKFWNEGITQIVAEDIGRKMGLPVTPGYVKEVPYVRASLFSFIPNVQTFARGYAQAPDKGLYVHKVWWPQIAQHFTNAEDWGADPAKGFLEQLRSQVGAWNPYTGYLEEIGVIKV